MIFFINERFIDKFLTISVKYSDENNSLQDRYMHLTNYSINRLSKSYTHNQDAAACQGHKWYGIHFLIRIIVIVLVVF